MTLNRTIRNVRRVASRQTTKGVNSIKKAGSTLNPKKLKIQGIILIIIIITLLVLIGVGLYNMFKTEPDEYQNILSTIQTDFNFINTSTHLTDRRNRLINLKNKLLPSSNDLSEDYINKLIDYNNTEPFTLPDFIKDNLTQMFIDDNNEHCVSGKINLISADNHYAGYETLFNRVLQLRNNYNFVNNVFFAHILCCIYKSSKNNRLKITIQSETVGSLGTYETKYYFSNENKYNRVENNVFKSGTSYEDVVLTNLSNISNSKLYISNMISTLLHDLRNNPVDNSFKYILGASDLSAVCLKR